VARVGVTYLQMADRSALGLTSGVWPSQTADARGVESSVIRKAYRTGISGWRSTNWPRARPEKGVPTDQLSQGR
jgi:hypothetical protein